MMAVRDGNELIDNSNYVALLHVEWGNTDNSYVILRFDNILRLLICQINNVYKIYGYNQYVSQF